ncbi:MAG: hypothetical protein JAZ15_03165 [Candidatus Thiodiazotropha endolucinida]|nr:hypothetical protein [Candidatus Thiodiazotropha taylori]MCW4311994.1 hypothetical protein [Candidatus Thiodiazotropha taylori]
MIVNIDRLKRESLNDIGGIIHVKNYFSAFDRKNIESFLKNMNYSPLYHEDQMARYEVSIIKTNESIDRFTGEIKELSNIIGHQSCYQELYSFKYIEGQSIPLHRDMDRHKITAIAYFGNFKGGEYIYETASREQIEIALNCGDIVISINELSDGSQINPSHRVNTILSGERYCLVASMVSSQKSNKRFKSNPY